MISEELKCEVEPSLYFAQQMGDANYEARISAKADGLKCYLECARVVDERLKELLSEIFDQKTPFVQTEDKKSCEYCDFKGVCRR